MGLAVTCGCGCLRAVTTFTRGGFSVAVVDGALGLCLDVLSGNNYDDLDTIYLALLRISICSAGVGDIE